MSGELIDYGIERQRHEGFVGRAALLARLDQLLVADRTDRWVVVTGGPGMGKSALLAAWLAQREAAGAVVPHHFIRRGEYDWDDPAKLVSSLIAQLEEQFPDQREPAAEEKKHPAARLVTMLAHVSAKELTPRGERLVVLIDGLDEYDPPANSQTGDPLAAFLPHALPRGVSFLCASRPRHPYVAMLEARDGELVRIDLDHQNFAADNEATVRGFWEHATPLLGLDVRFVDQAVARAGGNLQHAVTLRKHLAGLPEGDRRVKGLPQGLEALLVKLWERIATDAITVRGLGILCAAREALTLDELGTVAGWADEAQRQAFVRGARELLVETWRADNQLEYRLHHDSIRAHITSTLGVAVIRGHHAALAQRLATWPPPADAATRRYALRHAMTHRAEAGDWADAWRLAADMGFLEVKCRELGVHEVEADVTRAADRCRASGEESISQRFNDLARALVRESHWLRDAPEATAALVWNRLKRAGWSADDLDEQLRIPGGTTFLRVQQLATRESPALVRDLVGHAGPVTACAVTSDGRRVVSASGDQSLRVWDLDSGRVIGVFEGHSGWVTACTVTPDGRHVVSASHDRTLKVWDFHSGRVLVTFEGHNGPVTACAVTPDGRRVVSASYDRTLKLWDLNRARVLATFEGHAGWVSACAVTPDGRRVVSASHDRTLKVWDLDSARALATFEGHTGWVSSCAVTPDGRRVVSAAYDRTLKIWDLDNSRILATIEGHAARVTACTVTPDEQRVVSASYDRMLKVWELTRGRVLSTVEGHSSGVTACTTTPDGQRVVSASRDRTLKIWDLASGGILATVEGHTGWVTACTVTIDGRRVISASLDETLKVWDLNSGRILATLEGHCDWVTACAATPDSRRVVSASQDCTLKIWNLDSGSLLSTFEGHAGEVTACAVTPDGRRVISASADQTMKVWDLDSGRTLATFVGHTRRVTGCAVTPDGRRLVSASNDRTLKVWDIERNSLLATFEGHTRGVHACAVTPDGRRVISASEDQTLKVWDIDTHTCLFTYRGDTAYTAISATMTGVVAGDFAGTIWFLDWPSSIARPIHRATSPAPTVTSPTPAPTATNEPRLPTSRHVILFLAANPSGTTRLALNEECAAIERELRMTTGRDDFDFRSKWAVSIDEMMRHLNELQPTVIHFSGHGGGSTGIYLHGEHLPRPVHRGVDSVAVSRVQLADEPCRPLPRRDVGAITDAGIYLQDEHRQQQHVSARALTQMISSAAPSARVVVLNACFSDAVADELRSVVDCVVGMRGAIGDDAARSFAVGFYRALGYRRSVGNAVAQAVAALAAKQLPDEHLPICRTRDGISADQLILPNLDSHRS